MWNLSWPVIQERHQMEVAKSTRMRYHPKKKNQNKHQVFHVCLLLRSYGHINPFNLEYVTGSGDKSAL